MVSYGGGKGANNKPFAGILNQIDLLCILSHSGLEHYSFCTNKTKDCFIKEA